MPLKIAIVGGGFAGAAAAAALTAQSKVAVDVTLFDQGRRGEGGRASHRRVGVAAAALVGQMSAGGAMLAPLPAGDDDPPPHTGTYEFDHGCQFFRAETDRFRDVVCGSCV